MNIGKYWKRRFLGVLKDIWKGDRNMRKIAKRLTVMLLALAMVLAMVPAVSGPVYAADQLPLDGEVMASDLVPGYDYMVSSAGATIVLEAGDDVTVDRISTAYSNAVLTIKGSSAGKLTVTDGIDMPSRGCFSAARGCAAVCIFCIAFSLIDFAVLWDVSTKNHCKITLLFTEKRYFGRLYFTF